MRFFLCPFLFAQAGVESGARLEKSSGRSILSRKERIGGMRGGCFDDEERTFGSGGEEDALGGPELACCSTGSWSGCGRIWWGRRWSFMRRPDSGMMKNSDTKMGTTSITKNLLQRQSGRMNLRPGDVVVARNMRFRLKDGFKSRPVVVMSGHHHNQAKKRCCSCRHAAYKSNTRYTYGSAIAPGGLSESQPHEKDSQCMIVKTVKSYENKSGGMLRFFMTDSGTNINFKPDPGIVVCPHFLSFLGHLGHCRCMPKTYVIIR